VRTTDEEVAGLESRHRAALVELRAELEKEIGARSVAHEGAEERARKLAKAASDRDVRIADVDRQLRASELACAEANARIMELERMVADGERLALQRTTEHESAMAALRDVLTAANESSEAQRAHLDAQRRRELAELEAQWERRLAASIEETKKKLAASHDVELDTLLDRYVRIEHDRAEIQAVFDRSLKELEEAMGQTRTQLLEERQHHAATKATMTKTIDALNIKAASKDESIERLEGEAERMHGEIAELEGEILVLRTELLSVRRELDTQAVGARAAGAELERRVDLLIRAEKLFEDSHDGNDDADG
jgi:hypothetical protein